MKAQITSSDLPFGVYFAIYAPDVPFAPMHTSHLALLPAWHYACPV
jgi:hypothetical protein